ncbi:hypothetical protein ACJZ2D_011252 [Fusarium nematophilum]
MKVATILVLPALALAAATPNTPNTPNIEERQIGPLTPLPLDPACLARVLDISTCLPTIPDSPELTDLVGW